MVRVLEAHDVVKGDARYYEFAGTSEDHKPTENVATGSIFFEVDTQSTYVYNEDSEQWVEVGGNSEDNETGGQVETPIDFNSGSGNAT